VRFRNFPRLTYLQDCVGRPENGPAFLALQKFAPRFRRSAVDVATHIIDIARSSSARSTRYNAMVRTYVRRRPVQQGGAGHVAASIKLSDAPKAPVDVDDEVLNPASLRQRRGRLHRGNPQRWGRTISLTFEVHGTRGSLVSTTSVAKSCKCSSLTIPSDRTRLPTIYTVRPIDGESLWPDHRHWGSVTARPRSSSATTS